MSGKRHRPVIVNRSGTIRGDDGKRLYGMDAELHLKMKSKEDPEWYKKVGEWVREVTGDERVDPDDLHESLKSGEVLCELVNIIKPGSVKVFNRMEGKEGKMAALAYHENIKRYLTACIDLGVPGHDMFLPADLTTGRAMRNVAQNLASLSRIAQKEHGWEGPIVGPRLARPGPKKWQDIEFNPTQFVDDYAQSDAEEIIFELQATIKQKNEEIVQVMSREASLKHEVKKLRKEANFYRESHAELSEQLGVRHQQSAPVFRAAPVAIDKSATPERERKALVKKKRLEAHARHHEEVNQNVNEWQEKLNKIQQKVREKRARGDSFGSSTDVPAAVRGDGSAVDRFNERAWEASPLLEAGNLRKRRTASGTDFDDEEYEPPKEHGRSCKGIVRSHPVLFGALIVESVLIVGLTVATLYLAGVF